MFFKSEYFSESGAGDTSSHFLGDMRMEKAFWTLCVCTTHIQRRSYLMHYQWHAKLCWKVQWGMHPALFPSPSNAFWILLTWLDSPKSSDSSKRGWLALRGLTLIEWPNYPIVLSVKAALLPAQRPVMRWVTGWSHRDSWSKGRAPAVLAWHLKSLLLRLM